MIRHADLKDFDRIIKLMINYANAAPVDDYHNPKYNYRGVQHFLAQVKSQGCILVAEHHGVIQGMLIAQVISDPWLPHIRTLKEVAWWVEPEFRNTTMGYRLLRAYIDFGEQLYFNEAISNFVISTMVNSPDLKLEKRGWRKIESNYLYEGA